MGVVHKLKPEVIKFILDNKQATPHLSCRSLTVLLLEKLQVEVSKSSINAILKQNNLSMPVGRRQKPKKKKFNMPILPVIESIKTITPEEELQNPVLKDEPNIQEKSKHEIIEEQGVEKINLEEKRIQEAEGWAEKLLEKERDRLEQERLAREEQEKKAEKDTIREDLLRLQKLQEEEDARNKELARLKLEEEARFIEEQERLAQEEALHKVEEERIKEEQLRLQKLQEEQSAKQKEADRVKLEEETRLKEEQEKLAREVELKAEHERWARLSEEESKRKEALMASQAIKEEAKIEPSSGSSLPRGCTGAVLLKAIDQLIGGSIQLSEAIQRRLGYPKEEVEALTQTLIFQDIVGNEPGALSSIMRNEISADKLSGYFTQLQELKTMKLDLSRLSANIFTESRGIKMHFIDGSIVYLDAQMHTVWPTPYMPHDFSATVMSVKDCINRYFFKDGNLVLFMAPGYDIPTKEFFTLLLNFNSKHETADNLILYGNKLDELENIVLNPEDNHNLIFALWPWQFTAYRKVKRIGEFSAQRIDCMNKDFYLAEVEIELVQPTSMQSFSLKGCAIKLSLAEKIRLVILGTDEARSLVSLANDYLCRWPNLDEGLHDFNRKIELFSCTGESQQVFNYEGLPINKSEPVDLKSVFSGYSEALDAYLRWHFMPSGYEKIEFSLTKARFYSQKAQLKQDKDKILYFFTVAHDYAYAKDLEYICRRLNERDIRVDDGQRICFESGFK
ncbi:MAG: DUF4670 domain-containing protein [Candidatus Omnitrophica bacterium]|nr:DUF4670 domain-containing protein [Candidatus Omnitrophota bacterium]